MKFGTQAKIARWILIGITVLASSVASLKVANLFQNNANASGLSAGQRTVVRNLQRRTISSFDMERSMAAFLGAEDALVKSKRCLDLNDTRGALDNIINAKGYLQNVHPVIAGSLGVAGVRDQLLVVEKEFARQISESRQSYSKTGVGKHYPGY